MNFSEKGHCQKCTLVRLARGLSPAWSETAKGSSINKLEGGPAGIFIELAEDMRPKERANHGNSGAGLPEPSTGGPKQPGQMTRDPLLSPALAWKGSSTGKMVTSVHFG